MGKGHCKDEHMKWNKLDKDKYFTHRDTLTGAHTHRSLIQVPDPCPSDNTKESDQASLETFDTHFPQSESGSKQGSASMPSVSSLCVFQHGVTVCD